MSGAVLVLLAALCVPLFVFPAPRTALRNYLLLLPFLPEYLLVDVGVALTSSRIASAVFLLALVYRGTDRLLPRWDRVDAAFLTFLVVYLLATVPRPPQEGLHFAAGFLADVGLPYYFLRCLVRTVDDLRHLVRALLLPTYVIVALAGFQSVTGLSPFDVFKTGEHLFGTYDAGMRRLGLVRADVGLTHYIMLGLFFASQTPLIIGHYAGLGLDFGRIVLRVFHLPLGAFFSLSGGSFLVTGLGLGAFLTWPVRRLWALIGVIALVGVVYIETFSNRGTFAILATFAATDADSAWYRLKLPSAVFAQMSGHWWTGFGRDKPEMGAFNDITNHYLWWLMQGGLPCLIAFVLCYVAAFQRLLRAARLAVDPYLRLFAWGLGCSILALGLGLLTVSLFGQMRSYLFLFFALAACTAVAAEEERRRATVPLPADEAVPELAGGEGGAAGAHG